MANAQELLRPPKTSDAQRLLLQEKLAKLEAKDQPRNRRLNPRIKFIKQDVRFHIVQPAGGTVDCVVETRDISAGGISLVYWGFLHSGTEVRVTLKKRMGGDEVVSGKVTHCRHLLGTFHLVGVRFANRIFPKLFVDPSDWGELEAGEKVNMAQLTGKILLVDDQEVDRMLLVHHLRTSKLDIMHCSKGAEAVDAVKRMKFDLVICDLNLEDIKGEETIKQMRAAGYRNAIIVLTAETSPARLQECHNAGATAVFQKPYDPDKIINGIAHWMKNASAADADLIYSEFAKVEGMDKMLGQFITQVSNLVNVLRVQIEAENYEMTRRICQTLKGTGKGYGFPLLSEVATNAVKVLDGSMSVSESANELRQLENVCRRLTASMPKD